MKKMEIVWLSLFRITQFFASTNFIKGKYVGDSQITG